MFVEDNFICNMDSCDVLRAHGFSVTATYCASAAFEAISKHEHLSALVTDIDLGSGGDGFDVARHARKAYPHLPVVYISGTAAARHLSEGVKDSTFLTKPCDPLQIVAALNRAIRLEAA
ncbi:response regulator [Phenylobacterium sp.]|uniref:response regulator n=1 Tax=Phenylobacterium sp. TaxID=1871053 RepID=UPI00286B98FD|nr:response regulator [Phenylobacterium sp.]